MGTPNAITGTASVAAVPVLAPNRAVWTVNAEEKTSTASMLGGLATIFRRPDTGKFAAKFERDAPLPEGAAPDQEPGTLTLTIPLHDCDNLVLAQARAETLVRENLSKTHAELFASATLDETVTIGADAGPDPF